MILTEILEIQLIALILRTTSTLFFSCEEAALEVQMSVFLSDPKTEYYQG